MLSAYAIARRMVSPIPTSDMSIVSSTERQPIRHGPQRSDGKRFGMGDCLGSRWGCYQMSGPVLMQEVFTAVMVICLCLASRTRAAMSPMATASN